MDRLTPPADDPSDLPLQNRMIAALRWTDNGDSLGVRVQQPQKDPYTLDKKVACIESVYLRNCYTSPSDPYPDTTARLLYPTSQDEFSWVFILIWLRKCQRIRTGLSPAEKQPEISVKRWCQKQQRISFLEWSHIYCLAEALQMPRLEEHIRVAVELKAIATKRLPLYDAINYLYDQGSRFCTLKYVFIDMYAIAAMKPTDVFGDDWRFYPEEFVRDVCSYRKSMAYIERRKAFKECSCRSSGHDDYDEDNAEGYDQ